MMDDEWIYESEDFDEDETYIEAYGTYIFSTDQFAYT